MDIDTHFFSLVGNKAKDKGKNALIKSDINIIKLNTK
jgi:hypothetical protein